MSEEQLNEAEEQQPVDAKEEAPADNEGAEATDSKIFTPEQQQIVQGIVQKRVVREKASMQKKHQEELAQRDAISGALAQTAGAASPEQAQQFSDLVSTHQTNQQEERQRQEEQQRIANAHAVTENNIGSLSASVGTELSNNPDFKKAADTAEGMEVLNPNAYSKPGDREAINHMHAVVANYPGSDSEKVAAIHSFMTNRDSLNEFLGSNSPDYWIKLNSQNKNNQIQPGSSDLKTIPDVSSGGESGNARPSYITDYYK